LVVVFELAQALSFVIGGKYGLKKRGVLDYSYFRNQTASTVLGFLEKVRSFQLLAFSLFKSEISGETLQQISIYWQGSVLLFLSLLIQYLLIISGSWI
jgi:hypothetical protein